MIHIAIAGITGWTGKALAQTLVSHAQFKLVAGISPSNAGKTLNEVFPEIDSNLVISKSINQALAAQPKVLIDYTHPTVVKDNALAAISAGVHVVIGTSGLSDRDFQEIHEAAKKYKVGVIASGNFSLTAALLQRFSVMAAQYLPQWEIIDYASDNKVDSPSGTANELAFRMAQVKQPSITIPQQKTLGNPATRGGHINGMQVHSVRLPGFVLAIESLFGMAGEKLTLRHEAGESADPYVYGTLLAAEKVGSITGLIRGLDQILD